MVVFGRMCVHSEVMRGRARAGANVRVDVSRNCDRMIVRCWIGVMI